jgi:hypothetical protein
MQVEVVGERRGGWGTNGLRRPEFISFELAWKHVSTKIKLKLKESITAQFAKSHHREAPSLSQNVTVQP